MDRTLRIIKRPLMSEKGSLQRESQNKVYFEVALEARKPEIRQAIERAFNVKVASVNTMVVPGKPYNSRNISHKGPKWKKAVVELKEGSKIEFFKGV